MKKFLAVAFAAVVVIACTEGVVTAPTPVEKASSTSSPALTVGTPTVVQPPTNPAWTVQCSAGGTMTVTYNGEASYAGVLTFYTSFESLTQYAEQWDTLGIGRSVTRKFPSCSQGDAEPAVGHAAGHCYFDKSGNPASAEAATGSCTPPPPPPPCQGEKCEPTPRPSPSPSPSPSPTPPPPPPPVINYCYYEVDCGNQLRFSFKANTSCPDSTKKSLCEQQGGSWDKWNSQKEHCRIALPGVSLGNFQLTPGQSHKDCLRKQDED